MISGIPMQKKHRTPNLFNIYMIDVLCCALGCIIFLWLANMREARMTEEKLLEQTALLEDDKQKALNERDQARTNVAILGDKVMDLQSLLKQDQLVLQNKDNIIKDDLKQKLLYRTEIDAQKKDIEIKNRRMEDVAEKLTQWVKLADLADAKAKSLDKELNTLKADATGLQKSLAKEIDTKKSLIIALQSKTIALAEANKSLDLKTTELAFQVKNAGEVAMMVKDKEKKLLEFDSDLKNKNSEVADLRPFKLKYTELQLRLDKSERLVQLEKSSIDKMQTELKLLELDKTKQISQLNAELDKKNKELIDLRPWRTRFDDLQVKLEKTEKQVEVEKFSMIKVQQNIKKLEGDRVALQNNVSQLRAEVDNRFAGLELAGERVLFLIDASGSMSMLDEKTEAPNKWNEVRETLVKVLQSLPNLKKFQVIAFSEKSSFPLGAEGEWIDYSPEAISQVKKALEPVKPLGGTNMSVAFEEAFKLRDRGLDTIYLFSDGLPNLGEGIPFGKEKDLKDLDRSEYLSKYIRTSLKTKWNSQKAEFPKVKINTVGFFYESPEVGAFLWALARENNGNFVGMSKP